MGIELGTAVLKMGTDTSGLASGLKGAESQIAQFGQRSTSAFQRIGEVMAGVLGAQVIGNIANSIKSLGSEALGAYAEHEKLSMSLESLIAKEVRQASAVTETVTTGRQWVEVSAETQGKLADLNREYEIMGLTLKEQQIHYNDLVARYGEGGIATQKAALQMQDYQEKMAGVKAKIDELSAAQGHYVTTTETSTKYGLSLADAMEQSKEKAKDLLQWVEQLAIKSPFDAEGVAQALRMQMAYGNNVEQAKRLTQALIDFSAASGGSTQQMQRISLALGQMQAKGKVSGEEMRQLTEAGLPVGQILSEAFGKSTAELEKMREKGLLPAQQAVEAITKYLETNFAGAAEKQATSWAGLLSSFKEIKTIALRDFFGGIFAAVQPLAALLVDTFSSDAFRERVRAFGEVLGNVAKVAVDKLQALAGILSGLAHGVRIFEMFIGMGKSVGEAFTDTLDVLVKFHPTLQPVLDALAQAKPLFVAVGDGVRAIGKAFADLQTAFQSGGLPAVGELLGQWGQQLIAYVTTNVPRWVAQLKAEIGKLWSVLFGGSSADLDFSGSAAKASVLEGWWSTIRDYVAVYVPKWAAQLKAEVGKLWDGFATWWDTDGATLTTTVIGKIAGFIGEIIPYIQTNLPIWAASLATELGKLWGGFKTWWDTGGSQLTTDTLNKLSSFILGLITGYATRIPEWITSLQATLGTLWRAFVTWWDTGGSQLTLDVIGKIGTFFVNLFGQIVSSIPQWSKQFSDSISGLWETLKTWWDTDGLRIAGEVADKIGVYLKKMFDILKQNLPSLGTSLGEILGTLLGLALDAITGIVDLAGKLIKFIGGLFTRDNSGPVSDSWGTAILEAMRNAWNAFIASLVETGPDWVGDLVEFLEGLAEWGELLSGQGGELIDGLIQGISDKAKEFSETVTAWFQDNLIDPVKDFLGIKSPSTVMIGIATDMVQGLIDGINDMIEAVKTKVGEVVSAITDKFDKPLEMLKTAGQNIIDGLWKGISDGWDNFVKSLEALISKLPPLVQKVLGIASPSKVFADIGEQIIMGLIVGINKRRAEAVAAAAGAVQAAVDASLGLIELASQAAEFQIPENFSEILTRLRDGLLQMAGVFTTMGWALSSNNRKKAEEAAGFLSTLTSTVSAMADLAEKLNALPKDMDVSAMTGVLTELLDFLVATAKRLATSDTGQIGVLFSLYAQALAATVAPLQAALSLANALQETRGLTLDAGRLAELADFIAAAADEIKRIKDATVNDDLVKFAQRLADLIAPFKAMLDFWTQIADVAELRRTAKVNIPVTVGHLAENIASIVTTLSQLMQTPGLGTVSEQMATFAQRLSGLTAPFLAVLDFWVQIAGVAELRRTAKVDLATTVEHLLTNLGSLASTLDRAMRDPRFANVGPAMTTFADSLGRLIAPFAAMLDFWTLLAQLAVKEPDFTGFRNMLVAMLREYAELAVKLRQMTAGRVAGGGTVGDLVKDAQGLTSQLDALLAPFAAMLDFWQELAAAGMTFSQGRFEAAIDAMLTEYARIIRKLGVWLARAQRDTSLNVTGEMLTLAARLAAIGQALNEALAFLGSLAAFKSTEDLVGKFDVFAAAWTAIIKRLEKLRKETVNFVSDDLRKFSAAVGDIADGLTKAISLLNALTAYKGAKDFSEQITTLVKTLLAAMSALADGIDDWSTEALKAVKDFGDAAGALMTGLQAALDLVTAAPAKWTVPGYWDEFIAWTQNVFKTLHDWIVANFPQTETGTDQFGVLTAWGNALVALIGGLQAAVNFQLGKDWQPPDPGVWQKFFDWVTLLFDQFYLWVTIPHAMFGGTVYTPEGFTALTAWANALSALVGGLQAAANFTLSADWRAPDASIWQKFFDWVTLLFDQFYLWVTIQHPYGAGTTIYTTEGYNAVTAWGNALGALVNGLQAAANFQLSKDWQAPSQDVWNAFISWVQTTFATLYAWITANFPTTGTDPFGVVTSWGNALSSVMGGLQAALNLAAALPTAWNVNSAIWDAFIAWVQSAFTTLHNWITATFPTTGTTDPFGVTTAWGNALSALMGGLQAALSLATALPANWTVNAATWNAFVSWVQTAFTTLHNWIVANFPATAGQADQFGVTTAWGNALSALMGGLQAALSLATNFTFTEPNGNTWGNFESWVQTVMQRMVTWVNTTYPNYKTSTDFEPITSFGGAMQAVFGGLGAALDVFKGLQGYIGLTDAQITTFLADVKLAIAEIKIYTDANITPTINETLLAFGNAMSALFGGLQSALSLFKDLAELPGSVDKFLAAAQSPNTSKPNDTSPFAQRMGYLLGAIGATLDAFKLNITDKYSAQWLSAAGAFSAAVSSVLEVLKKALDLFTALDENGLPSVAQLTDLIEYVLKLFATFTSGLITTGTDVGAAGQTLASQVNGIPSLLPSTMVVSGWGSGITAALAGGLRGYNIGGDVNYLGGVLAAELDAYVGTTSGIYTSSMPGWGRNLAGALLTPFTTFPYNDYAAAMGNGLWGVLAANVGGSSALYGTSMPEWGSGLGAVFAGGLTGYSFNPAVTSAAGTLATLLGGNLGYDSTLYKTTMPTYGGSLGDKYGGAFSTYMGGSGASAQVLAAYNNYLAFLNGRFGQDGLLAWMYDAGYDSGEQIVLGMGRGISYYTTNGTPSSTLTAAITALVTYVENQVKIKLGIASPSKLMADLAANIPAGIAQGMLAGLPTVQDAAATLAGAVEPGLSSLFGMDAAVSAERIITVRFEGQAGGGVPLTANQFYALKQELAYAIRLGG